IALKVIKPEIASDAKTIERFKNELRLARKIRHKNICQMYDMGEWTGTHFITMEYVSGEDLKSFIHRSKQLSIPAAIAIAEEVCEGLKEAHRLGVVHRDLKPSNIMIDRDGNARIMDFGIARAVTGKGITGSGVMIGTPEYMSPEQAEGKEVDQSADLYSLGVILYEMVTGQLPFEGGTPLSIALKHKSEAPPDPKKTYPHISENLSRLILKCMEKDPKRRYRNAEEMLLDLKKIELPEPELPKNAKYEWKNSIAVLPFKNMSADPEQEYFCEGLSEELINALTQIKDLRVVARTSAFSFKDKEIDVREIGHKLDVETVLEGSVRKAGDRLRITAQLINVADGYHIWSDRFDRELADIFDIQDEISLAITDKLKIELLGDEKARLTKRYRDDFEAYNIYLKGLYFRRKLTWDNIEKAIELLNQAIDKDPKNALAWAGLAYSYMVSYFYGEKSHEEAYPLAKKAAAKALELDDQITEAYEACAAISAYMEWKWDGALAYLDRALELNPGYAWSYFHRGSVLMYLAHLEESIINSVKACELDPLNAAFNRNLGIIYFRAGQLENAFETLRRTIEMDPGFPLTHLYMAYIYIKKNMYKEALAELQKESPLRGFLEPHFGIVYGLMGQSGKSREILDELIERSEREYISPYGLALLYFTLDENDLGFSSLERACETRDGWMAQIKIDFLLDRVRSDPRFKEILKKVNLS
ncbi:MAG: protein kinase, partial [Candidatus Aminicenantes bacterium]